MLVLICSLYAAADEIPCLENETYTVSVASSLLSKYNPDKISLRDLESTGLPSISLYLPQGLLDSIEFGLGYIKVLVIAGIVMFVVSFGALFLHRLNFLSSPKDKYWVLSVRSTRLCAVFTAFVVAMLAATGLFYVYEMQGVLMDPIIAAEEVIGDKYRLLSEAYQKVNDTATKFSVVLPPDTKKAAEEAKHFIDEIGMWYNSFSIMGTKYGIYSSYATLLLSCGFGLVISTMVIVNVFVLTKHRCIPNCTVICIYFSLLVVWLVSSITGFISLVVSKECNNGIDQLVSSYTDSTLLSSCASSGFNHYLFCSSWNSTITTNSTCGNPILSAKIMTETVIKELQAFGPLFLPDILNLQLVLSNLVEIDDCTETKLSYNSAKMLLCWDVTNSSMRITSMFLLLWVLLLAFLLFIFFSWYRFNLTRTPEDAFPTPNPSAPPLHTDYSDFDSNSTIRSINDGINSNNYVAVSAQEMGVFLDDDCDDERNAEAPRQLLFLSEDGSSMDPPNLVDVPDFPAEVRTTNFYMPELKSRAIVFRNTTKKVVRKYFTTISAILALGFVMLLIIAVWLGLQGQYEVVETRKC